MTNFTLRQLRYFEALAQHRHFGRAADACSISQPALSMQIRDLEEIVATPLFERGPREITLTSFGEEFAQRASDILRSVDDLAGLAQASRDKWIGRMRLGVIPTIAPYLLPRIIRDLTRENPDLDIHIRETLTSKLLEELAAGKLDAAILALPISDPAFEEVALFSEDFILVRPKTDAEKPVPSPEMLREMRLLLLEEGHCFRDQALTFCSLPAAPRERMDGSSLSTLVQMVGSGIGVTLIPEMAIPIETRASEVSVARFAAPAPQRVIGMIWRRSSPLAGQLLDVAEVVRSAARDSEVANRS